MGMYDIQDNTSNKNRRLVDKVLYDRFVRTGSNWNSSIGIEIFNRRDEVTGETNHVLLIEMTSYHNGDSSIVIDLTNIDPDSLYSIAEMFCEAATVYKSMEVKT